MKNYCKTCAAKKGWQLKEDSKSAQSLVSRCDICSLTYELFEEKYWTKRLLLNEHDKR
jgi:hypothetical protein